MQGIRDELRRLDEAREKGAISDETYKELRRQIMDLVEEAQVVVTQAAGAGYDWDALAERVEQETPAQTGTGTETGPNSEGAGPRPRPEPRRRERMSDTTFFCSAAVLAFVICLGALGLILGDLMAGFTITLGLFAAGLIWAGHRLGLLEPPQEGETDRLATAMARARRGFTERSSALPEPEPPSGQH